MKKNVLIYITLLFLFYNVTYSQNLKGKVFGVVENYKEKLTGANIFWINTSLKVKSNSNGEFEISLEDIKDKRLVVSHIGYKSDTIEVGNINYIEIMLSKYITTEDINVEGDEKSTYISSDGIKKEIITQKELKKAACCDLSGCFGNTASAEISTIDVVTDSKELRLLGLDGVYTQILVDGFPTLTGLKSKYGLSSIPGTLIDKIYIAKGSNSVLQGYESISGEVNVLLKQNEYPEQLFLNAYTNSFLEKQFNANFAKELKNWNTIFGFHSVQKANKIDNNNDTFLDVPLVTRYLFYNNWNYGENEDDGFDLKISAHYLDEKRNGGQVNFNSETDKGSSSIYGQTVDIKELEILLKSAYTFENESVLKLMFSGGYHKQDSYFGITKYFGTQNNFYVNLLYDFEFLKNNRLKTGLSYKYENLKEEINFLSDTVKNTYYGIYEKKESIPGIFIEDLYTTENEKLTVISGLRFDYHNKYKLITTPRLLVKYDLPSNTVIRASIGTGFRTANIFIENSNILASSRNIVVSEELNPEKVINYGINLTNNYVFDKVSGTFSIDYYRTDFQNQIIVDYDSNPQEVIFSNLKGKSYSNSLQIENSINFNEILDLKIAYKYLDLIYELDGNKTELPFNSKHRLLSTISFTPTLAKDWMFNLSSYWFGKQRLPSTEKNPEEYQREKESEAFALFNFQVLKVFKEYNFEIYIGAENVFDFKQDNPIISWQDPFGEYFDTSFIWGPVKGRELYAGFRLRI